MVGNCGGGRSLAVAVPPAVRSHFLLSVPPAGARVVGATTHVQAWVVVISVLGFSPFCLLVGYHREGGGFFRFVRSSSGRQVTSALHIVGRSTRGKESTDGAGKVPQTASCSTPQMPTR